MQKQNRLAEISGAVRERQGAGTRDGGRSRVKTSKRPHSDDGHNVHPSVRNWEGGGVPVQAFQKGLGSQMMTLLKARRREESS